MEKTVEQPFSAKEKVKGKAQKPKPSTSVDGQSTHLLQWLHDAEVPENVGADVLENPIMQLALAQVLNKLYVARNQRDKAHSDLFCSALGKGKQVVSPPHLPEPKKACTKPSVFVKGSLTQRAPLVPYNDQVPASEDQLMDVCPDFGVPTAMAGPSRPAKGWLCSVFITTPAAFLANMLIGSEEETIEVLGPKTYTIPATMFHMPTVHWDPCNKKFFVIQVQAS
ncbi:hypothetical protein C0989_007721 [Termitomyces sp. Mn162]|nr:hypothetical protein C0989_007721 [Termitomyces sp. Mn162]